MLDLGLGLMFTLRLEQCPPSAHQAVSLAVSSNLWYVLICARTTVTGLLVMFIVGMFILFTVQLE